MMLTWIVTTVARQEDAAKLAQLALDARLAACVQTETIESRYRWKGEVVQERELRLLFKTTAAASARLQALLKAHHPYEEPALYALQPSAVAPSFAAWVAGEVVQPGVAT